MNIDTIFKLFETKEKNLLKSMLISFPCFYLVGYFYFPQIVDINLFCSILIIAGVSVMAIPLFYLVGLLINGKADSFIYGFVTSTSIAISALFIVFGLFWGFNISTFYIILAGIISLSFSTLTIAVFRDRKKKHKKTIDN